MNPHSAISHLHFTVVSSYAVQESGAAAQVAQLLVEGKISPDTYEEWNRETGGKKLPERVRSAAKKKTASKKTGTKKTAARAKKKRTRSSARTRVAAAKEPGRRRS